MKEFLKHLISLIVDHPNEVNIEERPFGENMFQYLVVTNSQDTGKVIGKKGKIIQAIRNVAKILAIKEGKHIRIEIG